MKYFKLSSKIGDCSYLGRTEIEDLENLYKRLLKRLKNYRAEKGEYLNRPLYNVLIFEDCIIEEMDSAPPPEYSNPVFNAQTVWGLPFEYEKRLRKLANRRYNQKNKEKVYAVVECECGRTYQKNNKSRHFKTYHSKE